MIFTPLPQAARPSRLLSASPRPLALEARFMFDGAAAATGAEALVDTEPSVEASQASPVLGIAYPISNTDGEITREASHVNVASTGLEIGGISLPDTDEEGHGNDVLVRMDIGGTTYYGWISGQTRARDGYYFWTDPSFTTAQDALDGWKQGNKDNDKNNVGFILATGSIQITEGQAQINSSMDVDKLMKCLLPVPNAIPLARNDTETVSEDSAATTIDVLTNDEDSDGGTLTVTGFTVAGDDTEYTAENNTATFPGQGTLTLNADGTFTFTPAPNFHGDLPAITYTLSDGQGGFATATLSISVTPVNDIPVARNDAETVNEDSAATTIDVLANDEDSDGGTLTVTGFTVAGDDTKYTTENNTATFPGQGTLTLNADGTFTFTPAPNFHGDL
ncbi:MAG: Hemolysin, plasmid, partial [Pseudomonadota bacterium]